MATRSRTTFQKHQKEMKRIEKQRMKAERRAQKRLASRTEGELPIEISPESDPPQPQDSEASAAIPPDGRPL